MCGDGKGVMFRPGGNVAFFLKVYFVNFNYCLFHFFLQLFLWEIWWGGLGEGFGFGLSKRQMILYTRLRGFFRLSKNEIESLLRKYCI